MTKTNTHLTMKPIYEGDLPPIVSQRRTSEQVERANRLEAAHAYAVKMETLQPALNSSTYDKAYALAAAAPALLEALEKMTEATHLTDGFKRHAALIDAKAALKLAKGE